MELSEELIVKQCSSTLAGLKTGNMFTCPWQCSPEGKKAILDHLRTLNSRLAPYGLRILPLRFMKRRVLIYMYRPKQLSIDLEHHIAKHILGQKDYPTTSAERCIVRLIHEMQQQEGFPHEIGLFLGYPAEDVLGFIQNQAQSAKWVGAWKVYGDETAARCKCAAYKRCTRAYCQAYRQHHSLDQLLQRH